MSTQTNQDKKQIILGLIIIGIIFYVGYLLIVKLWSIFSTIDPRLGAGIVAASATVIVSLISVLVSKHLDKKAEILAHLREKKVPTYEKIIEFIFNITFSEKLGKEKPTEKEMIKFMADVTQELVIWGSDEMIDAFYKFRMKSIDSANGKSQSPKEILFTVESLLLAIRKDLGHKNKNMPKGKLLGLFVNDLQV
ncbi:MAG: hypothetical protein WCY67_12255 [Acidithiobacillus sp.]